jgi:hypothetical protein
MPPQDFRDSLTIGIAVAAIGGRAGIETIRGAICAATVCGAYRAFGGELNQSRGLNNNGDEFRLRVSGRE